MIISTTSKGSLVVGDWCVVEVSRETSRILRILARVRYLARLTSSSITVVAVMVKRSANDRSVVSLPDNEDVGVFVCGIVFSLQEVEFKGEYRSSFPSGRSSVADYLYMHSPPSASKSSRCPHQLCTCLF